MPLNTTKTYEAQNELSVLDSNFNHGINYELPNSQIVVETPHSPYLNVTLNDVNTSNHTRNRLSERKGASLVDQRQVPPSSKSTLDFS